MKVLLITTPPNAVLSALEILDDVELFIVNCACDVNVIKSRVFNIVKSISPDIILTYRCPYILPYDVYSKPRLGSYNIHPSLLPKHPGLNPWKDIMNDESQINGVTLHRINDNIDNGEIIFQHSYSIATMNVESARHVADDIASKLVCDLIYELSC